MGKYFLLLAVLDVGLGGSFALLIALLRTPFIYKYLPQDYFYSALVGHVVLALFFSFLNFLIFLFYEKLKLSFSKLEFTLSLLGSLLVFLSALFRLGKPLFNNYIPTIVSPVFFLGLFFMLLCLFLVSFRAILNLKNSYLPEFERKLILISSINSLLFPITLLISLFFVKGDYPSLTYFENLFWIPGHTHQFINACLLLLTWKNLLNRELKASPLLYHLLIFPLIYLFLPPFFPSKDVSLYLITTVGYGLGIGLPTYYYLFKMLRYSLSSPYLLLSLILYALSAGAGYLLGFSQDLRVPAHYHGVIASILLALMGNTFYYLKLKEGKLLKAQPYLYGLGMLLFVFSLFWSGFFGAPRKVAGVSYAHSLKLIVFLSLMGLGSVLAVLGGVVFVFLALKGLTGEIFGNKLISSPATGRGESPRPEREQG